MVDKGEKGVGKWKG